jgi:DNA-binding response OmpR family regulator
LVKPCATTKVSGRAPGAGSASAGRAIPASRTPSSVCTSIGALPRSERLLTDTSAILSAHLDSAVDGLPQGDDMRLVLMTAARQATTEVLPALGLLGHQVRVVAPELSSLLDGDAGDVVLVDARHDLIQARTLCGLLSSTGVASALVAVLSEGGLVALSADWGVDDVLLDTAGPAEVDARLKWATARRLAAATPVDGPDGGVTKAGELVIDEHSYSAKLRGRPLDLTYKEFELLKYLAQHPGRVFSRAQLLQEIWGYDYFGGTRTVDVHVRRLRAKLGTEHEALIGTVRNVGYKLDQQVADASAAAAKAETDVATAPTGAPLL